MEEFGRVLAAAQAGEPWALTAIYRTHNASAVRYLRGRAGDDAEDLAADIWVEVARSLSRFQGDEDAFRGWLFTIVRRRLSDVRRRRLRRRTDPVAHLDEYLAPTDSPERAAETGDATRRAVALVRRLPPDQAEVVLLRVMAGLDTAAVADIMGKTPGAIRILQHRALQRLAQLVAEHPL